MSKINPASFDRFEKIPKQSLSEISDTGTAETLEDNLVSDEEIFKTNEHANSSFIPTNSDMPKEPISGAPIPIQQGMKLGATVSGKFVVDMTDVILPALLVWVVSMLGYGVEKKILQLSAKEKETLTPLFQAYLDSINVNLNNPLNNLLFGISMVYGAKFIEAFPTLERKEKGKKIPEKTTVGKVVELVQKGKNTDDIIAAIAAKRKKGIKEAIEFFNANKKKFGKEHEPDIKIPE